MTFVLAVGPFVPPVHGAAIVTERAVAELEGSIAVVRADIGRSTFRSTLVGLAVRATRALAAGWHASRPSCRAMYLAIPAGRTVVLVMPVVAIARLGGKPFVLHHHSFAYLNQRSRAHAVLFRLAGDATHVALCNVMAEQFHAVYRLKTVIVVSNTAFVPATRPPVRLATDRLTIGHLSNLSIEKGLGVVLDVTRHLIESGHSVTLRLGGPPVSAVESHMITEAQRDLGPALDYRGAIEPTRLAQFFDGIDVFVFPSLDDAQPLVVLEALSFGVPCVTSAVGCLPEVRGVTASTDLRPSALAEDIVTGRFVGSADLAAALDADRAESRTQLAAMVELLTE